ncbi:hypothetical protein ACFVYA_41530 [Amycolatopsis sp. NPDC058278]|uniref:hypothetical protein n=1 Tax=Amycolatopsis sp. NPDC058278 TaxID=3346417 RepID=UPI0036D800E4
MPMMDRALLQSAIAGDPTATDTVLSLVRPAVLTYCRTRLESRHERDSDAEDFTQEVMLGVLRALPPTSTTPTGFWASSRESRRTR